MTQLHSTRPFGFYLIVTFILCLISNFVPSIPKKPTLHWIKDGKQLKIDEPGFKATFDSASETQVTSDLSIAHFGPKDAGEVSSIYFLHYDPSGNCFFLKQFSMPL